MTGADVVRVCSQSSGDAASLSACTFFFQGALDALRDRPKYGPSVHILCAARNARPRLWRLSYLSESERYPEVPRTEQATDLLLRNAIEAFSSAGALR